jgi:hypothetical protein
MAVESKKMLHAKLMRSEVSSFGGYHRISFGALGTQNEITFEAVNTARAMAFRESVFGWLADFESKYSVILMTRSFLKSIASQGSPQLPWIR